MIHSGLKLQNSVDKEPELRTDIEMIPTLSYRPKVNLKDNLTEETGWALGSRTDSCPGMEGDQIVKIHLGYDAIKSMNLISNDNESEDPDGYYHMTSHKYEINLLSPGEGLSSPFERQHSPANTKEETGETQREVSGSTPFKKRCANTD